MKWSEEDATAIKAELYDLQGHRCNGRLTLRADGKRDPGDHPCTYCQRVVKLQAMLRELTDDKENRLMATSAITTGLPYAEFGYHVDSRTMTTCSIGTATQSRVVPVDVRAFDVATQREVE